MTKGDWSHWQDEIFGVNHLLMQIRNLPGPDWSKEGLGGKKPHICMNLLKTSCDCSAFLDKVVFYWGIVY